MRYANGGGTGQLSVQVTDQNGTAYVNVALSSGNQVKFSRTDPFGAERSEATNWRSQRGYVGGDDDAGGGLVHLGAREYDPSTGRFLSADPVLDLADPVQMNGYVYCENNPVTYADPSGLASQPTSGGGDGSGTSSSEAWAKRQLNTSLADVILSVGWAALKDFVGWNDVMGCFSRGDLWACGSLFIQAIPWTKLGKIPSVLKAVNKIAGAINAWMKAKEKARKIIEMAKKARELARKAKEAKKRAAAAAAQLRKKAREAATRQAKKAAQKTGNAVQKTQRVAAKKAEPKPRQTTAKEQSSGGAGGSCESNSFLPGTHVLMADGTTKPIEDVRNGDKVTATDPETGETAVETVTAEIQGTGVKHLVKVAIATGKGDRTAEVTATEGHPFWVPELGRWTDATDLRAGEWLRTSAGTYVQVTAVERWTTLRAVVHNLTVSDLHTYYVVAGATPVLVHNCGGGDDYLYRGVPNGHPKYDDALEGRAVPHGGHSDPGRHAGGNTDSEFTSWTHDYEDVALDASDELGPGGIVMRIPHPSVPAGRDVRIHGTDHEVYEESEHALRGVIDGAEISINRGPWFTPGGG
jgi:RHS repeat-associated protein